MFFAVDSTPYDRQMERVRPVLASLAAQPAGVIPLGLVNQWMNRLRDIPYHYSRQWQIPAEITMAQRTDCKGKALLLYEMMQENGATNVRFVIGKHHANDWFTHAWLEWETQDGIYLLDPTFYRAAARDLRDDTTYIPLFGYEGENKYRAFDVTLVTQN
jgi:predicted transglutaminase-like cysteine proteinase